MSLITIDRKIFSQKKRFSQVIMNKKRFSQIKISTRKYIFHGGREGGGRGVEECTLEECTHVL